MAFLQMIYFLLSDFIFAPMCFLMRHFDEAFSARVVMFSGAFVITIMCFYFSPVKTLFKKLIKVENINQFFIVFASSISFVFVFFALFFLKDEEFSFSAILSVFILVFISYLLPLYLGLVFVEKQIIKHVEAIATPISKNKSIIKEIRKQRLDEITIESEKTKDSITFQIANLQMIEGQGNYCMFYICVNGACVNKIMHITMKTVQENLVEHSQIVRCHKSFIVNIDNVVRVSGISRRYVLHFENEEMSAPVSRIYQEEVMKSFHIFKDCVLQN